MRIIYQEVLNRIKKIDFESLWSGFTAYDFALYDHDWVCFEDRMIPVTNVFMGNTTILYDGQQIAMEISVLMSKPWKL